ncbi:MAG: class I SAM-dependent methyltransferase [Lentisphaerae bacterium]|nr:class I SAM-dependent methyltransferase [Lentisphaerota bacterium]
MKSRAGHWDQIFSGTEDDQLGWYEASAAPTLALMATVPGWQSSTVFLPGAGTSVLIEELLSEGVPLVLNDISRTALEKLKKRLGVRGSAVHWLCQDIAQSLPSDLPPVDIWVDRAVLHFLIDEADIEGYFTNLRSTLRRGGYALFAEFSKEGAAKCAGLDLHRYSVEELSSRLGDAFELKAAFDHTYINPGGDPRPYIYALYKRTGSDGFSPG